jgi:pSer/pThr/pTyr-binding forkhead associated (FHA) protein
VAPAPRPRASPPAEPAPPPTPRSPPAASPPARQAAPEAAPAPPQGEPDPAPPQGEPDAAPPQGERRAERPGAPVGESEASGLTRPLRRGAPGLADRMRVRRPRLIVKSGLLRRSYELQQTPLVIGRDEAAGITISDETVSAQHAELSFDDAGFWLRDLGSSNGTAVDGVRLPGASRCAVRSQALLAFAEVEALLCYDDNPVDRRQVRLQERAARWLARQHYLTREQLKDAIQRARRPDQAPLAEIVLLNTDMTAAQWSRALAAARRQPARRVALAVAAALAAGAAAAAWALLAR